MIASCSHQLTSPQGHTNVIQYFNEYYNETNHVLFYVLDTKVNAQNGANINSNKAGGAQNTIYSSIYDPSYLDPATIWGYHIAFPISYGHLEYEDPNGKVQTGQNAQVTVSSSVKVGASYGAAGVSATVGVSYTYDLYNFCYNEIHGYCQNDQWLFISSLGGQSYAHFVTMTSVFYNPGYRQGIFYSSIGNTTWSCTIHTPIHIGILTWCTTQSVLKTSSLPMTSDYISPILN